MAEPTQNEAAKKQLAVNKQASDKSKAASQDQLSKGKPTPTQEENDLAALGAHVIEKEHDGSEPDPNAPGAEPKETHQRNMEGGGAAGYQTRQATPSKPATPRHE